MSREPWNGSPVKAGNWGTWAQIEVSNSNLRQSCYTCIHHNDGECILHNAVISEIGKGFFRQCKDYSLDDFQINTKKMHDAPKKRKRQINKSISIDTFISNEKQKGRCKNKCIRYTGKDNCVFFMGKCIGVNACKMYLEKSESKNTKKIEYTKQKEEGKKEVVTIVERQNNTCERVDKVSSILPIKRTMQEQFGKETKEIILAYKTIQKSYQSMIDQIQLKVSNCMKLMDFAGAQRILADFEPFAQKIKKELENIESILNDFE